MWNIVAHSFYLLIIAPRDRGSSVGIATRYGPEGPGIESWWSQASQELRPNHVGAVINEWKQFAARLC